MNAIYASDLHLKGEKPVARLDGDWLESQRAMLSEIVSIANSKDLPLVLAGDIFDHSRVATEIVNMSIAELKKCGKGVCIIAGNHDLPGHSFDMVDQSSIGILLKVFKDASKFLELNANHFGLDGLKADSNIRITHQLVFEKQEDCPPNAKAKTADQLLDEFQEADWIICGDMHKAFHYVRKSQGGDRHVVNLGCTIRHKANEISYQPSVWHIDPIHNVCERIYLSDSLDNISRDHLDTKEAKESRVDALWESIRSKKDLKLDFLANLEDKVPSIEDADTRKEISELIALCKRESK